MRVAFAAIAAVFVSTCGCMSCTRTSSDAPGVGSSGGAGPTFGSAGMAARGGAGSSGTTNGIAGIGGSGATGSMMQPALEWTPVSNTPGPCPFKRLANPGVAKAFDWVSYPGVPGVETTRWTSAGFHDDGTNEIQGAAAEETDGGTRIAISVDGDPSIADVATYVLLMDGEGTVLDGVWTDEGATKCIWTLPNLWHGTLGIAAVTLDDVPGHTAILVPQSGAMTMFGVPKSAGGAQMFALGDTRWTWWWIAGARMRSYSVVDGSEAAIPLPSTTVNIAYPSSAGSAFFFDATAADASGNVSDYIGLSDGIAPMTAFLGGAFDGYGYGTARDAGTFVTWRRAKGRTDVNFYDTVELWASPFTLDPNALEPFLVGTLDSGNVAQYAVAGHGFVGSGLERQGLNGALIWDLANRTSVRYDVPEATDRVNNLAGMTRTHMIARTAAGKSNRPTKLMRFPVTK